MEPCLSQKNAWSSQGKPVPTYDRFFVESVYNLRPTVAAKVIRPPRYISQYSAAVEEERRKPKRPKKTFGVPNLPLSSPTQFLRKSEQETPCPPPALPTRICYNLRRGVPRRNEWTPKPVFPISRDMVARTKQKILQLKPKVPTQRCVDRRNGDILTPDPAALTGKLIFKADYGKVPGYVKRFKKRAMNRKKDELSAAQGAELVASQSQYRCVSEEERASVLRKLQENFDEAMHHFQALSFSLDNQSKIKTKTTLERKLNELEKTIQTVKELKKIVIKLQ